jgi:hypothetical protein
MKVILALFALLAFLPPASAQTEIDPIFGTKSPGASFTLTGKGLSSQSYSILLRSAADPGFTKLLPATANDKGTALSFDLPDKIKPGPYYVTVQAGKDSIPVQGGFEIGAADVKVESVHPDTQYRLPSKTFDFVILGENFSTDPKDDHILIDGQGDIEARGVGDEASCVPDAARKTACFWVTDEGRTIHVKGYSNENERYQGPLFVRVRVGQTTSADHKQLVLARMSQTGILLLSAIGTLLLFWIVSRVVRSGLANNRVGKKKLQLWESFIFDPQTNSYSLSKFQILLFSATFLFGYIYVFLASLLVQWKFALPDVPSQVAGLLGISGGTVIASAGLSANRGTKGAGLQYPTGADLICTGGVVAPERFQFFVWTIVACFGFLILLTQQDPAHLAQFPDFPSGLLYVMGVSAAGYLGGKAVRKAGPVISNILADCSGDTPVLIVQGSDLATDGNYLIDEVLLPIVPDRTGTAKSLVDPTLQNGDAKFATELRIEIDPSAGVNLCTGDHRFRIVNRDGQYADMAFAATPVIKSVYADGGPAPAAPSASLAAGNVLTTVVIFGKALNPQSSVTWKAAGMAAAVDAQLVLPNSCTDGTMLRVQLVPGPAGTGTLTLKTPSGLVATKEVTIHPPAAVPPPEIAPTAAAAVPAAAVIPQVAPTAPATAVSPVAAAHPVPPTSPTAPVAPASAPAPSPGATGESGGGSSAPSPGAMGEKQGEKD